MLSSFEGMLLDRHLRSCGSCRAFAAAAVELTDLLREASLEQPGRRFVSPVSTQPNYRRRRSVGAVVGLAAAAVAAVVVYVPGWQHSTSEAGRRANAAAGPMIVVVARSPNPANKNIEVPRLKVKPVSTVDHPVHGQFDQPVVSS